MTEVADIEELARRFDAPGVQAIALVGSHTRGDAGPHSDVDLVRFLAQDSESAPDSGSHLIDGRLVVVSDVRATDVEKWFSHPEMAVSHIPGLRHARPLIDSSGSLADLQHRAHSFLWNDEMQTQANAWASEQMLGLIEEVHKGLEGLRRNHTGRLLNARFGLSWLLSRIIQVQRGVFLSGDNDFFEAVETAVGLDTEWARLRRVVFGVEGIGRNPPTLRQQVMAGLRLYVLTAELLADVLRPADAPLVNHTADRVRSVLQDSFS